MFSTFQLLLPKGFIHEDFFRHSTDPIVQKLWKERIEPYMDQPNYPTVRTNYTFIKFAHMIYGPK